MTALSLVGAAEDPGSPRCQGANAPGAGSRGSERGPETRFNRKRRRQRRVPLLPRKGVLRTSGKDRGEGRREREGQTDIAALHPAPSR